MKFNSKRVLFAPYTSIPVSLDTTTCLESSNQNAIDIRGTITAGGAGFVYLLQGIPELNAGAGAWHVHRKPGDVNSANAVGGRFHHTWLLKPGEMGYFQLLVLAPLTAGESCAELSVY